METSKSVRKLERLNRELSAYHAISSAVSGALELDEVLDIALSKLQELTGFEAATIFLLNEEGTKLNLRASHGVAPQHAEEMSSLGLDESLVGQAVKLKKAIAAENATENVQIHPVAQKMGTRSYLTLPLQSKGRILGAIGLGSFTAQHLLSPEVVGSVSSLAAPVAAAIDRAQAYERLQEEAAHIRKANEELSALSVISLRANLLRDIPGTYKIILDEILSAVECESGAIRIVDHVNGLAPFKVHQGLAKGLYRTENLIRLGECLCGQVADGSQPDGIVINDCPWFTSDPERTKGLRNNCAAAGYKSMALLPIKSRDQVIGVLYLASYDRNKFGDEKVGFLETACNQLGQLIDNVRLYEEERTRAVHSRALHKIGESLLATTTVQETIDTIMKGIHRWLRYQRGWLRLVNREKKVLGGEAVFGKKVAPRLIHPSFPLNARLKVPAIACFFSKKPILIRGPRRDPSCEDIREDLAALGVKSLVVVPLMVGDEVLGVLGVNSLSRAKPLTQQDVELLTAIANLAGLAISRTRFREQIQKDAVTDSLTRLFNRHYFDQAIAAEMRRARRYKRKLSLIFLDVRSFKEYNDAFGHLEGDRALRSLGRRVQTSVRDHDVPCRYGGDEFMVVLPETGPQEARLVAERVRWAVEKHRLRKRKLSIDYGVASYPEDGEKVEELIQAADRDLYRTKP